MSLRVRAAAADQVVKQKKQRPEESVVVGGVRSCTLRVTVCFRNLNVREEPRGRGAFWCQLLAIRRDAAALKLLVRSASKPLVCFPVPIPHFSQQSSICACLFMWMY